MRLPKHSNFIQSVSRSTLQFEGHTGDDAALGREANETMLERKEAEDLYAKLDKIVSKRLKLKRVLGPPDETSPSKRRKVLKQEEDKPTGHQQDSEPVVFRLVSKWLPPRPVHLNPKPSEVIPVGEPPCEDTDQELRERVYRSTLSAVDLEQIKQSFPTTNRKLQRVLQTTSWSHTATTPLLLLEIFRATPTPALRSNSRVGDPPAPSPHQLSNKGVCCPTASVAPSHTRDARKKGRRRRGKPKNKNKLRQ